MSRSARAEVIVSLIIIAICSAVLWESLGLPPGSFEPLGPAPVPQATAGLIILLSLLVIYSALHRQMKDENVEEEQPVSALFLLVLTLIYVALLHSKRVDFGLLTTIFLVTAIWGLERFRTGALLPAALTAAVVGFGCSFLFTRVFVVDLPTWG
ncbi:MAG: tripartite tricarboxylate transporter TctB family protein [Hyphomicrobiaceae bacterium]